ncbi:DUF4279 domain-containing protein [Paraburkholderia caffeinilytica]|uniref:DUF4279 domain-containing protein n=1 Tax=Paraburkholderia caffeinilytica TaxID=1761016 RepID=UPI000E2155BD|nr:DUF4279 domain-containing protein [Paraburkholderia caffeinilytica]
MNNPATSACDETFVTLCVYPKSAEIFDSVDEFSLVPPTLTSDRNGVFAWFWSTQSSVASRDVGEHLKFIVNLVSQAQLQMATLEDIGCKCWLSCFWVSSTGNGGPGLEPDVIASLSTLNLPLYFDIYFAEQE